MATDLQIVRTDTTALAIAEPASLTTPRVSSALNDFCGRWDPADARRMIERERADIPTLIAEHEEALLPSPAVWLKERLENLWKSMAVPNGFTARAWLGETGRLLVDVPQDILSYAIDEAVKRSARGFLLSVSEIRAIADPMLLQRRRHLGRLKIIRDMPAPAKPPAPEERCTPEQAAAIIREVGLKIPETQVERAHRGPPTMPTRDDYLRWGVDPADIPTAA